MLDLFPVPELHVNLRVTNHICDNLTKRSKEQCGTDKVLEFAKANSIVRKNYHGGSYEGNQCNRILKKAHL